MVGANPGLGPALLLVIWYAQYIEKAALPAWGHQAPSPVSPPASLSKYKAANLVAGAVWEVPKVYSQDGSGYSRGKTLLDSRKILRVDVCEGCLVHFSWASVLHRGSQVAGLANCCPCLPAWRWAPWYEGRRSWIEEEAVPWSTWLPSMAHSALLTEIELCPLQKATRKCDWKSPLLKATHWVVSGQQ